MYHDDDFVYYDDDYFYFDDVIAKGAVRGALVKKEDSEEDVPTKDGDDKEPEEPDDKEVRLRLWCALS